MSSVFYIAICVIIVGNIMLRIKSFIGSVIDACGVDVVGTFTSIVVGVAEVIAEVIYIIGANVVVVAASVAEVAVQVTYVVGVVGVVATSDAKVVVSVVSVVGCNRRRTIIFEF